MSEAFIQALIVFLICFPFVAGLLISFAKKSSPIQSGMVYIFAAMEIIAGIVLAAGFFTEGSRTISFFTETEIADYAIIAGELFLMILISVLGLKRKKYFVILLSVFSTLAVIGLELFGPGIEPAPHILIDRLSVLMVLIVCIVGGLINVYAVGYMKGYHNHHKEFADRTNIFLPLLMVFLGAMCGLVLSASLVWLFFFWECTSTISFLLIGYTRTDEAVENSFKALWMNLLGGWGIVAAIFWAYFALKSTDMRALIVYNPVAIQFPLAMLAFAAFTKSAMYPFSGWLLGAMVAPTPSSALLHSATMVKAGVYLLIRIAPAMGGHAAGIMTAYVGGFTFFICSMLAITVSDAKRVLAYSTISNLGLMVACCGVGTVETICAAVMLMIFHALSKSMLFQAVGAVENSLGSRDIENWGGLILRLPKLATVIMIGILGMYTAPFGMLISKWAALKAFVDSKNVILILIIAFGSATTMFYWTKFLSKILSLRVNSEIKDATKPLEYFSMFLHAVLVVGICVLLSFVLNGYVQPMLMETFSMPAAAFSQAELNMLVVLLVAVFLIPFVMYSVAKSLKSRTVPLYMAGVNSGDNNGFINSFGDIREMSMSNWYMEDFFGEKKLVKPGLWISSAFIVIMLFLTVTGGVL